MSGWSESIATIEIHAIKPSFDQTLRGIPERFFVLFQSVVFFMGGYESFFCLLS